MHLVNSRSCVRLLSGCRHLNSWLNLHLRLESMMLEQHLRLRAPLSLGWLRSWSWTWIVHSLLFDILLIPTTASLLLLLHAAHSSDSLCHILHHILLSLFWIKCFEHSGNARPFVFLHHLLEELVLGGEMQDHLLVALLSLRARLKSAGVLELLAIEIVGQQLPRLKVFFGGRSKVLELALGEVVL